MSYYYDMSKQGFVTKVHFDNTMSGVNTKFDATNARLDSVDARFDSVIEKLDWLIGAFKRLDEEHVVLSSKVSEHTDNLEIINEKLEIQV